MSDNSSRDADLFATILGTLPLFDTLKVHVPNSLGDTFLEANALRKNTRSPRIIVRIVEMFKYVNITVTAHLPCASEIARTSDDALFDF